MKFLPRRLAAFVFALLASRPAFCAPLEPDVAGETSANVPTNALLLGAGVAAAFTAHEAGHVVANLLLGNRPSFVGIRAFGFLPFFSIDPHIKCVPHSDECHQRNGAFFGGGRAGAYAIFTAGFSVQHLTDEVILQRRPNLRFEHAPFEKGVLLFNIATSIGYASAAWLGVEDTHGDLNNAGRVSGIPHSVLASFLLVPAILDAVRYSHPGWTALPTIACTSKYALLGAGFLF